MFKFSKRSRERMVGVNSKLISVAEEALLLSKVDFGVAQYGGFRREDEQHKLFLEGKSKADGLYKKSYHQSGNALDVFAYVNGKASWEIKYLSQIASAMLQAAINQNVKLEWGGLWDNFIDMPHFQINDPKQ
jgi:hypothetical protein